MNAAESRARIDADELALVLSQYEVGAIHSAREYKRGSRRSPKLLLQTDAGDLLLKRRAPGRDDPYRVAYCHSLQIHLHDRGYPTPQLLGTSGDNNSMVQMDGRIYELFEFMPGDRCPRDARHVRRSGRALARLHDILRGHSSEFDAPESSFHKAANVGRALDRIPKAVAEHHPDIDSEKLKDACAELAVMCANAANRSEACGLSKLPSQPLHGDWHPGNLLFEDGRLTAVVDFDSARCEPRIMDVANAALQCSLPTEQQGDPESWPKGLELDCHRAMVEGYDERAADRLSDDERCALPWLMVEALIVETAAQISTTGRFGRAPGGSFVLMVRDKVAWIEENAGRLAPKV